jgi:capsular polysaccharide biosynthesis protein
MELRRYLHLIRQRLLLVVLTVLAGLLGGYAITQKTPMYRAKATIYVGSQELGVSPNALRSDQFFALDSLATTFAAMITTPPIAEQAVAGAHVDRTATQVANETKAAVVTGTNLIQVTVDDADPAIAQKLANSVATTFTTQLQNYEPGKPAGPGTLPQLPAYVFVRAALPTSHLPTGLQRDMMIGGLLGLFLSIAVILLLDYLDLTVRRPEDVERRIDLPVLGVIPLERQVTGNGVPVIVQRRPFVSGADRG